tara:strand:+ start:635 stop:1822 length:1188 start_codon:yes stop_codon:yes gene_type:complete
LSGPIKIKFRVDITIALIFFISISNLFGEKLYFQNRCLWVVRYSLASKSLIDEMLRFAVQYNFNHIFVQVRGRGDSLYRSSWIPQSEVLIGDEFDPLEYVIQEGHKLQLNVHVWVNVYMLWSAEQLPLSEQHLFNRHPDWLDAVKEESNKYLYTDKRLTTDASGKEGFYLAPHHPSVNPYLLAVFKELLNNYNLDGLHLDYVRYKNEFHGYNSVGIEQFRSQYNSKNNFDLGFRQTIITKDSYNDYLMKREEFLLNSITELVLKLSSFMKNSHREMILSAAVKPNIEMAKKLYFQEWDMWLSGGLVDWVLVMNYGPNFQTFVDNITSIENQISKSEFSKIIMGVALYNQTPENAVKKIQYSYNAGFKGIALFSYNVITEHINKMKPVLSINTVDD